MRRPGRFACRVCTAGSVLLLSLGIGVAAAGASRWRVQNSPQNVSLAGVSCASGRACIAVGDLPSLAAGVGPRAAGWDGVRWAVQRTPSPVGAVSAGLGGVSCRAAACVGVGSYTSTSNGLRIFTLAERWDGRRWTIEPTPSPGVDRDLRAAGLGSVSCPSTTACTAVGGLGEIAVVAGSSPRPLAERWNGRRWTVQTVPELPFDFHAGSLSGVSCPSVRACVAVGATPLIGKPTPRPGSATIPFAERWDGRRWRMQRLPIPAGASDLHITIGTVSCTSAAACTAIGKYGAPFEDITPFAERWNGRRWTVQRIPSPAGVSEAVLNAVSCTAARTCTAVGNTVIRSTGLRGRMLAEQWNGVRWTIQRTPNPPRAQEPGLSSVSCTSAAACTAIGHYTDTGGGYHSFVERYS
jgi:hypothetical protein